MKSILAVCLIAAGLAGVVGAQDPTKPVLRQGISVEMPAASEAVEIPAADEENATVVTVTGDGKLFVGTRAADVNTLTSLRAPTVYVKADARAPFQRVLTVLDALAGHWVVLLTAPTVKSVPGRTTPPYGIQLEVGGRRPN